MARSYWVAVALLLCGALYVWGQQPEQASTPASAPAEPPPLAAEHLRSPRATMKTFLAAVAAENFALASQCMDFSGLDFLGGRVDRVRYAKMLGEVLQRLGRIDLNAISDDPAAAVFRFPTDQANPPIVIARDLDGSWRFTAGTVGRIPELHNAHRGAWFYRIPYTNNEVWRLVALLASILAAIVLGRVIRYFLGRSAGRFEARGKELSAVALRAVARSASLAVFTIGLAAGLQFLVLPQPLADWTGRLSKGLISATIAYIVWCLVDVVTRWLNGVSARSKGRMDDMLVPLVSNSLRGVVIVLALVQIAAVLSESPVTSLLAGLGVGGLAIGLAAQDTLKNFFGSLMIFSDRPFELGDRIVIDGREGPVETVGFRSTRVRTGDGLVTIPNGDLANKAILNVGKPAFLKRVMNLRLSIQTPPEKVGRAVALVKEILADHEGQSPQRPPAVAFNEITDTAFNIAVTYFYSPADGPRFTAFNERVNMEVLRRLEQENIHLATPSQRLELSEQTAASLGLGKPEKS